MARLLVMPSLIALLLLLPFNSEASASQRKNSLRVRRARLGQGLLPPLLLSLPSQVQEVAVAPAASSDFYLSPSASEQVAANSYLSPLPSELSDFVFPLTTEEPAPASYLAPESSEALPSVSDYLGPALDQDPVVGYPDTQSVDITYLPPRDDPPPSSYGEEVPPSSYGEDVVDDSPNQPTNPSKCTLVEDTIVELVEETQCRQMVRCRELVQCRLDKPDHLTIRFQIRKIGRW